VLTFYTGAKMIAPMARESHDRNPPAHGPFDNLGTTLLLVRGLRGKSQSWVARTARIGKSQLSKYETGKELPKLESLAKVLGALGITQFTFFYTLHLVDQRAAELVRPGRRDQPEPPAAMAAPAAIPGLLPDQRPLPWDSEHLPLLNEATDRAFARVFEDLLLLHRRIFEQVLATSTPPPAR
jgi:transcriptional regulator with XRE-family HTH domain